LPTRYSPTPNSGRSSSAPALQLAAQQQQAEAREKIFKGLVIGGLAALAAGTARG